MDVVDIERKAKDDAQKEILIFNPLNEDVECLYGGNPLTIVSKENKWFKLNEANHIGNFLIDLYVHSKEENYQREKAHKLIFPHD